MLHKITSFADKYNMLPPDSTILVCVSGGADSMCLLTALLDLAADRMLTVVAAHFNHRLRGDESDRDERFVRDFCESTNVRIVTGSGDVPNSEDAARRARYAFFDGAAAQTGAARIATAHTADDNAETVIMNLTRGSGTAGLSGIPPVRGAIIRPMLTVTRDEVMAFLLKRGVPHVEDSTNFRDIYTRNKIRGTVMPVLREVNPKFADAVTAASALLRADEVFLQSLASGFIDRHVTGGVVSATLLLDLPDAVAGRVVRLLCGPALTYGHVADVLALCRANGYRRLSLPGMTVCRDGDDIVFDGDMPEEFAAFEPVLGKSVTICGTGLKITCKNTVCSDRINKSLTTFLFKKDEICGRIVVRPRVEGERIKLAGRGCTKSLKKLFAENRIPARRRALVPVVADEQGVLAVYGLGASERAMAHPGCPALEIKFEGADND